MRLEEVEIREPAAGDASQLAILWRAVRPLHWVKNVFVFAPVLFARQLGDPVAIAWSGAAFVVFCLAASGIYLINDVWDIAADRRHPSKSMRPITRGSLSRRSAIVTAEVLFVLALAASIAIGAGLAFLTFAYIATHILYTVFLKKVLIVDAVVIAVGFVLRVLAGAAVIGVEPSQWIILTSFFLALLIAFSKRRYEIFYDDASTPESTRGYSAFLLDIFVMVSGAAVLSSYVGYVLARGAWQNGYALLISVGVVLFGIFRYLAIIYQNDERLDHTKMILTDGPLMTAVVIWLGLTVTEIYFFIPKMPF